MRTFLLLLSLLSPFVIQAQIISTIAGNAIPGYSGDGGTATSAQLNNPTGIAKDTHGNIYIGDAVNNRVRKISPSGIITTFAGNGTQTYGGDGGPAALAGIEWPTCIAFDGSDNAYIVDRVNCRIRKVNTAGIISTIAGDGSLAYGGDGGPGTAAQLHFPWGIVADYSGNVYFSDQNNNCIRKVSTSGIITAFAGDTTAGFAGDGGQATAAKLNNPTGITMDCLGNIYIVDQFNSRIRKVDPSGIINTIAGNGTVTETGDGGQATAASFRASWDIKVDGIGNIYLADGNGNRIRKIDASGVISTFAGGGSNSGEGVPATAAFLNNLEGLMIDSSFNVYVSDYNNARVRKITGSSTASAGTITGADSVCPGLSVTLATNGSTGGQWTSSNTSLATVTSAGIVTGVAAGTVEIIYSVTPGLCVYATYLLKVSSNSVCNTGIGSFNAHSGISIYPNPVFDELSITAMDRITNIIITNLLGQTVYSNQYSSPQVRVDVANLPRGLYLVKVNGTEIRKFLKE